LSPGPEPVRVIHGGPVSAPPRSDRNEDSSQDAARTIGRYALHAEIAAGGMATVHIGRLLGPVGFARTVAIKKLHPPLAKDPEFVAMFLDEARLAARIRHPNVVSTLDVVATEGELFVVMEYVPGESLARLLRAVRTNSEMVPVPIAATIMVGVLHGLHAAHEARDERGQPLRIVHRDVSPHNILIGTDGDAHVIDFGIAKARGRMQVTRQGQIKGKLSYMPAEQLLGQPLDQRADVFAASIVLWECLTGQRLFQGTDDSEVYAKVLLGKVDPPSLYAPELTPAVDEIVMRGLARDRNQRFTTAREMALALEAAIPLAPPSQVGRWVEGLVGDSLAERTEQIAGIERLDDIPESRMTPSALKSIGAGSAGPSAPLENRAAVSGGGTLVSRMDRTAPTQPHGIAAAAAAAEAEQLRQHVTIVDRPERPAAEAALEAAGAESEAVPPRKSRRGWLVAALLLIPVLSYGAWASAHRPEMGPGVASPRPEAVPSVTASAASRPGANTGEWTPVPVPPPPETDSIATGTAMAGAHKAPAAATGGATRPAPTRTAAPQGTDGTEVAPAAPARTNGASCDPPFWIDSDGTKRYNRHCATP
jgi:serine/threonine protein kinase